jgi:hypothetical protein
LKKSKQLARSIRVFKKEIDEDKAPNKETLLEDILITKQIKLDREYQKDL